MLVLRPGINPGNGRNGGHTIFKVSARRFQQRTFELRMVLAIKEVTGKCFLRTLGPFRARDIRITNGI